MGFKTSTIIIHKQQQINKEELLSTLGFTKLLKTGNEPFEIAMYPKDGKIYIGTFKENLFLCVEELPMLLIEKNDSYFEKKLIQQFPNCEIC